MIEQILFVLLGCSIVVFVGCEFYEGRLTTELVGLIQAGRDRSGRKRLSKRESEEFGSITIHPLFRRAVASSRLSKDLIESDVKHLRSDPRFADWHGRYSRVAAVSALSLLAFIAIIFGLVMLDGNSK